VTGCMFDMICGPDGRRMTILTRLYCRGGLSLLVVIVVCLISLVVAAQEHCS